MSDVPVVKVMDELPPPKCRCILGPHFCIKHICQPGKEKCMRLIKADKNPKNYVVYLGGNKYFLRWEEVTQEELDKAVAILDKPPRHNVFDCLYFGEIDNACTERCWSYEHQYQHCPRLQRY